LAKICGYVAGADYRVAITSTVNAYLSLKVQSSSSTFTGPDGMLLNVGELIFKMIVADKYFFT